MKLVIRGGFLGMALGLVPLAMAEVPAWEVDVLPAGERGVWTEYAGRSQRMAASDQEVLRAELTAAGLQIAMPAPSGADFKLPKPPGDPWYGSTEAANLADVVISYQTPAGGWSKHTGYSRGVRRKGMLWSSQYAPGRDPHYLGTFDNHATTAEIELLTNVWAATKRDDCRAAVARGIGYVLNAQYPNGGWPQVYPLEGGYHDAVTLNDDAMTHILSLLQTLLAMEPTFLDGDLRKKCEDSLANGISCAIRMQYQNKGWSGQHDALTLQPAAARAMEPAALVSVESANLLKFLMMVKEPDEALVKCIEGGLRWLDAVAIRGMRLEETDGATVCVAATADSDPLWARFYDLHSDKPIFPGRDGVIYSSLEELARHNTVGYDYFSSRPGSVTQTGQTKWRKMLAEEK